MGSKYQMRFGRLVRFPAFLNPDGCRRLLDGRQLRLRLLAGIHGYDASAKCGTRALCAGLSLAIALQRQTAPQDNGHRLVRLGGEGLLRVELSRRVSSEQCD